MRYPKPNREFWIPKGATKVVFKDIPGSAVYFKVHSETYTQVMGFAGRAQKPVFHYRYKNLAAAQKAVAQWAKNLSTNLKNRADARKKDSGPHDVRVGDIFTSSWGYDQTNVYFYQVVALKGTKTAILKRIGADSTENGWLQGTCMPVPNAFIEREGTFEKRVQLTNGRPHFKMSSYEYAYPWDGKAKNWTAYH